MSDRMLLSPSVVRIVRPGLDVRSPPSLTPEDCIVDSSWETVQRLVASIKVASTTLETPQEVFWDTQDEPPLVALYRRAAGSPVQTDPVVIRYLLVGPTSYLVVAQRHLMKPILVDGTTIYQRYGDTPLGGTSYGAADTTLYDFFLLVFAP